MTNIYTSLENKLFILESGKGNKSSIVFLHGVCSSSNTWLDHMNALANFHCIAPDFPGHGKSNQCQWTNIHDVTDWIAQVIHTKCNGRAHIVGLSLGGAVGLNLLNKYPKLVNKAIIDGCSAKQMKGVRFILFGIALVSPFIRTNFLIKLVTSIYEMPKENIGNSFIKDWKAVRPRSFRRSITDANTLSLPDNVSHITSPVLFVSGEKEPEITHRTHKLYSTLIPGSKCFYYPHKNHGWLAVDVQTHIDLCKYWFEEGRLPEKLVSCSLKDVDKNHRNAVNDFQSHE
ncbi:MAG TPA: alpha/beta hydrolase [Flavitalea sp.]|nr:alpha/beta hydrolase [Flavitalea sp.]